MSFGVGIEFCNYCYWLLVSGNWQTRLLKKSGVLTVNGLGSNI
jgi:hypothetical protein